MHERMKNTPIISLIMKMSLPAMFSMLISALYNIVDSIFVARLGEYALTSVSLIFPIQNLIIAFSVGTGVGLNSLISRRLGEKNQNAANDAANHGLILGILNGLFFAVIGILFTKQFVNLFTDDPLIFENACTYNYVVTIFSFAICIQIINEKMIQATGDMIYPMIFNIIGAVINIILDPILIFGYFGFPRLEVLGAAIATVIGQVVAMIMSLYVLYKKQHVLKLKFLNFKMKLSVVKDIFEVGFPSIVMQSIGSLLIALLNKILIGFSDTAVSVLGIYFKLQSFVFMPVFGITQGVMPIMGYNFGAKDKKRLIDSLKISTVMASVIMILGTGIFWIFTPQLFSLFGATQEMLDIGIIALRIISSGFIFAAVGILLSTLFQACGFGTFSLMSSLLRQVVIILPLAYIFGQIFGLEGVWYAFPISDFASFVLSVVLYFVYIKKVLNSFEVQQE